MKKLIAIIACAIALISIGCTDAKNAERVLTSQGYTDVKITGYDLFGCSDDDWRHTGFTAKGTNGQWVNGVVCQGLFLKGATVRIK